MTDLQAKRLGALITEKRTSRALSLRTLATMAGISHVWLTDLEWGRYTDPAPDRLARLADVLDIEPRDIDRITKGTVANVLPGMRTYFRAKYDLTPEQIAKIERYVGGISKDAPS